MFNVIVSVFVVCDVYDVDVYIGCFEVVDIVDVCLCVSGYFDKVVFQDGVIVCKGDLLFVIDLCLYQVVVIVVQGVFECVQL